MKWPKGPTSEGGQNLEYVSKITMGQDAKEPVVVICVIYVFTFSSIMLIFKIQD